MAPAEWDQVLELFHAAVESSPNERSKLLDEACGSDTAIRKAVEDLLREHDSAGSFLSRPAWESAGAAARAEPFAGGQRFQNFVLQEMLGRGGMGEVWSARDGELDRPVALKFLRARSASESDPSRIVREAQAASALNHPNIVTIYGVVRCEEIAAIVMELVEGSSLATLRNAPRPIDEVLAIGAQIAQALKAAHANHIVHGDIKPENIVQRHDGLIKVLDFGLAHRVAADGIPATHRPGFGTMRYMSPEQARSESLTAATDVFSFGLVMYELAAGRHPFAEQSAAEAMVSNIHRTPPAPSSLDRRIPAALNALILAMLAKDAWQRPSAAQVVERLDVIKRGRARAGRRLWLAGAVAACLFTVSLAWWLAGRRGSAPQFANLRIEPLTSQDGWEGGPAFSPDGKSIAFTWAPDLETAPQLYVKRDMDSAPVKITDGSAEGIVGPPAWSADGKRIAFKRVFRVSSAIFVMPSGGGEQRKLTDLRVTGLANAIDWSPDGTEITFSDLVSSSDRRLVVYVMNAATGEKRRLTNPASLEFADWDPKFSPDGRTIAFKRVGGFWDDAIYTIPASGGEAFRVTWEPGGIIGHTWTRDGKSLVLSCQRGTTIFGLWRFPLDRRSPPERIIQGASDALYPTVSRVSGRLSWVNQNEDVNIYRAAVAGGQPQRLIASTARDRDAEYAPDGRIAFVSDRSGSRDIWLSLGDGSGQRRITSFNSQDIGTLAWSPDGRRLAFYARSHGRSDIYTLDCEPGSGGCGAPKLTISGMQAAVPGWSQDGKFLYFASDRSGRFEVWRAPASSGEAIQVTHNGGIMARESPDGKWLYFSKDATGTLWRMRLPLDAHGSSTEELVIGSPHYVQQVGWALSGDEIIFVDGAAKGQSGSLRGYRLATGDIHVILPFVRSFADSRDYSVSVSQDGNWIIYSQLDRSGSNVMVAERQ